MKQSKNSKSKKQIKKQKRNYVPFLLNICGISLFAVASTYLFYILFPLQMIPQLWLYLAVFIFVAIGLIYIILALLKLPKFVQFLRHVCIILLSGVLFFASYMVTNIDHELEVAFQQPTSYKEYVSIIALREKTIHSLTDLEGKKIAYQSTIDTNNMQLVRNYLDTNLNKYTGVKYQDYSNSVNDLLNGKVDAIILSENYRPLIEESYVDFTKLTARVDAYEIETPVTDIKRSVDVTKNSFTVFVNGIDTLGSAKINSQSDVNMLVTINPLAKSITMVTIPRDSYLPNACLGYQNDKITNTGAFGIDCTAKSIENAFDVEINYYVKVSFSSIIQAVNALGGLEVNVPYSFCERKGNRKDIIYVNKGLQVLNGEQALALARNRKNAAGGDVGRGKNQAMLVNAAIKKFVSSDIISVTEKLLKVVNDTVQTNLTKQEIYAFINAFASDLGSWTLTNHSAGGKNSWGECASMPGRDLSIIELPEEEFTKIKYILKNSLTDSDLSEFTFNINDIEVVEVEVENDLQGSTGGNFCWITEEYKNKENQEQEEVDTEEILEEVETIE